MNQLKKRIAFDVLLGAVLIFEMFYTLTGNFLHELVGMLFMVGLIVHVIGECGHFLGPC